MINYNRLGYEIKRDFTNFSLRISKGLRRPQEKFVHQMTYGILAGNKLHLSEIARSLKESITLKKTIDRLSKNLHAFDGKDSVMHNYLGLVGQQVKDDYAVTIIDNSDIAKPAGTKLEALSEIRGGSTGEITQGYLTIEAAVLSEKGKMPLPVYEKVFSAAENGFISETQENLCCLRSLTENSSSRCIRTLDRGFDANEYYCYSLKHGERFVIRAKKNRNVIYDGQTCNTMDVALRYKGACRMDFKDKKGRTHAPACNAGCRLSDISALPRLSTKTAFFLKK